MQTATPTRPVTKAEVTIHNAPILTKYAKLQAALDALEAEAAKVKASIKPLQDAILFTPDTKGGVLAAEHDGFRVSKSSYDRKGLDKAKMVEENPALALVVELYETATPVTTYRTSFKAK